MKSISWGKYKESVQLKGFCCINLFGMSYFSENMVFSLYFRKMFLFIVSCREFSGLSFYKKSQPIFSENKRDNCKIQQGLFFPEKKQKMQWINFFQNLAWRRSLFKFMHFQLIFFLIDSLNVALQNCFCHFSLRWNMRKLEQK